MLAVALFLCRWPQRNRRQVDPAVSASLDEGDGVDGGSAAGLTGVPSGTRQSNHLAGFVDGVHFHDGYVRHVGPWFTVVQCTVVELVVQFADAISAVRHPDENCRSQRDKSLHIAHRDFERCDGEAHGGELLDSLLFGAVQWTWRKDGNVGVRMGVRGMQVPPHFFYEHASRTSDVSHGRIREASHLVFIIPTDVHLRRGPRCLGAQEVFAKIVAIIEAVGA